MVAKLRHSLIYTGTLFVLVLVGIDSARAGWVTIKNTSSNSVVIQEVAEVNGELKRGKPTHLLPGETIREYLTVPTNRKVELYNSTKAQSPSWFGNLHHQVSHESYLIADQNGSLVLMRTGKPQAK